MAVTKLAAVQVKAYREFRTFRLLGITTGGLAAEAMRQLIHRPNTGRER